MSEPLVTISIPTLNSAEFLETCLAAIESQTYRHIEVNIVDGGSVDKTLEIAKNKNVKKIFMSKDALLEARYLGVRHANGKYVLMLDSDQVLKPDAINRAVKLCEKNNMSMAALGEGVFHVSTLIEKLFVEDRKLINEVKDLSPMTGVMLPRFYRLDILLKAMNSIPEDIRKVVGGQDHAIIYYEAWQISNKVGVISDAVDHIEPNSLSKIWKKFYRWGKTSVGARFGKYDEMLKKKEHFRTGLFKKGLIRASFASILLLLCKGVPYKIGYFIGKVRNYE